ncbi:MAG: OmpA family protein [Leptolyngbyaceae cyanobacterium MO_188.B28]|nr:OmpA family protein [Leptolyngbyaceae cyanobacterium MO_188.B28]
MAKQGLTRDTRSQATSTAPATGRVRALLTFIFRLLLLGVGSGGAWLAGVAIAMFYYPAPSPKTPLQEIVLRRSIQWIRRVQQLPELWNQSSPTSQPVAPNFSLVESAPPILQPAVSNPAPTRSLTATEQQQVKQTLTDLQTELQDLSDRTANLETQLGQTPSSSPVESRLQSINQQINAQTDTASAEDTADPTANPVQSQSQSTSTSSPSPGAQSAAPPSTTAVSFAGSPLKVTLPSDLLFEDNQEKLRANANSILDRIIPDLAKYPGAAILISSHTDNQSDVNISREITFQQAISIERHLAQSLGQTHHLVPVGYGQTRPLTSNDSAANRQRNRRIEIIIEPW